MKLLNEDETGTKTNPNRTGIARELVRIVLPTNYYAQWYWKIDLHNLLHFIALRADSHAQFEIRAYAYILGEIVSKWTGLWKPRIVTQKRTLSSGPGLSHAAPRVFRHVPPTKSRAGDRRGRELRLDSLPPARFSSLSDTSRPTTSHHTDMS